MNWYWSVPGGTAGQGNNQQASACRQRPTDGCEQGNRGPASNQQQQRRTIVDGDGDLHGCRAAAICGRDRVHSQRAHRRGRAADHASDGVQHDASRQRGGDRVRSHSACGSKARPGQLQVKQVPASQSDRRANKTQANMPAANEGNRVQVRTSSGDGWRVGRDGQRARVHHRVVRVQNRRRRNCTTMAPLSGDQTTNGAGESTHCR